jgi:flagellar hook-associated protein 3 FlgL
MKISGFPGFDAAAVASGLVRARVTDLTSQVASGQRSQTFSGLGQDATIALDLRSERARRDAFASAARRGEAFAEATQLALGGIQDATRDVLDNIQRIIVTGLPGSDGSSLKNMAETARGALKTIVGLLGERFAGDAVFGGAAPDQAPIISAAAFETTGLFTRIGDEVRSLSPGNGNAVLTATKELALSNDPAISPFRGFAAGAASGLQPDARRSVPVGEAISIPIGMFAYRNAAAVSEGQTTGSWSRDLMWGLTVIANLEPSSANSMDDYRTLVDGAVAALRSASSALIDDRAALGVEQSRLAAAAERNENLALQIEVQIGKIESVDLSDVITQLTGSQIQLEASYRAMVTLGELSLTKFMR